MKENNFKDIDEHKAPEDLIDKVKKETEGNVGFIRNIFTVLDIYIVKFFSSIFHGIQEEPQEHKTDEREMAFGSSNPFLENEDNDLSDEEGIEEDDNDIV